MKKVFASVRSGLRERRFEVEVNEACGGVGAGGAVGSQLHIDGDVALRGPGAAGLGALDAGGGECGAGQVIGTGQVAVRSAW